MTRNTLNEIRRIEFENLKEELDLAQDRTAFFPTEITSSDTHEAQQQCFYSFKKWSQNDGAEISKLDETAEVDAVVFTNKIGKRSVWAACHNKQHKMAYQRFWWTIGGMKELEWIDGARFHIDHAFNKARVLAHIHPNRSGNLHDPDTSKLTDAANIGYIRLFLVPSDVNTSWGREIEKPKTSLAKPGGFFRGASWLILAKIARIFPPQSFFDVEIGARALFGICGLSGFADLHSLTRAYCQAVGLNGNLSLISSAAADGVRNCFIDSNDLAQDPELYEIATTALKLGAIYPLFETAFGKNFLGK